MKLLFTHSYFRQFDPKQVAHAQPYPPLGTILAAAFLREHGHTVSFFDTMFSASHEEIIPSFEDHTPDVFIIYDDGFNYLTKMCLSNMRDAAFRMIREAKMRGCKVIVTSSDASDHYEKYLDAGADFVITGEAEHTLLELITYLESERADFDKVPGLVWMEHSRVVKTASRPVSKQLDMFPLPAWDLVDIEPYRKTWMDKHGYFSINVATTRGCPYKCNWCAKPIYGNAYNMRSPENVIREIKYLADRFNFDHIWFCDDIFGLKRIWVSEFSTLVNKEKLRFRYKIQSRADLLVQQKYVDDLAASGCSEVWMGAESGSQKILDAMEKGTTVGEIRQARKLLKDKNIRAAFFLQFGYPGENEEDIRKTIGLVTETLPDDIGISVSYPLPGTTFFDKVKDQMKGKTNWSDSDDLALMFRNTYSNAFYKQLHRYVHKVYRQRKAEKAIRRLRSADDFKKLLAYPFYRISTQRSLAQLKQTEPNVKLGF